MAFALFDSKFTIEPIIERGAIGVIIPNKDFRILPLKEIIKSSDFQKSCFELPIILGRTMKAQNIIFDLITQPQVLVAGATGQGKSVLLNNIILSLLNKKHPAELKFILIDTHLLEFNPYSLIEKHYLAKLPHFEKPVISNVLKAEQTLLSLCKEMDNRYELLSRSISQNIRNYNQKFKARKLNPKSGNRFLPYIVVIIDEYSDLAMQSDNDAQLSLIQLTRKAHVVGIHIILATQRPTNNIITDDLKANFLTRIAFKVSSSLESKLILNDNGAENLSGRGDALYFEGFNTTRIQVPYVSTEEVVRITSFIGNQRGYESSFHLPENIVDSSYNYSIDNKDFNDRDILFDEVARLIVMNQQGSTSLIQRKFSIGYNRAGRIMNQLEVTGIVGPDQGSKPRDVYITDEYSLERILREM